MKRKIKITTQDKGFALILTVSMLVLMAMVVTGLLTLSATSLRSTNQRDAELEARANARMALGIALGQLQKYAGADQRTTARADILKDNSATDSTSDYWTGVWPTKGGFDSSDGTLLKDPDSLAPAPFNTDNPDPVWLVSGANPDPSNFSTVASSKKIKLVTKDKAVKNDNQEVEVEKVAIRNKDDRTVGEYAYWVSDENVKARVNLQDEFINSSETYTRFAYPHQADPTALKTSGNAQPFFSNTSLWKTSAQQGKISALLSDSSIAFAATSNSDQVGQSFFHDLTTTSASVLSDTKNGGLKNDLTNLFRLSDLPSKFDQPIFAPLEGVDVSHSNPGGPGWEQLKDFATDAADGDFDNATLTPKPPTHNSHGVAPVVTRINYVVQAFAEQTSPTAPGVTGYRFTAGVFPLVTLWNPYDRPMDTSDLWIRVQGPLLKVIDQAVKNGKRGDEVARLTDYNLTKALEKENKFGWTFKFSDETIAPGKAINFAPRSDKFYSTSNLRNNLLVPNEIGGDIIFGFYSPPVTPNSNNGFATAASFNSLTFTYDRATPWEQAFALSNNENFALSNRLHTATFPGIGETRMPSNAASPKIILKSFSEIGSSGNTSNGSTANAISLSEIKQQAGRISGTAARIRLPFDGISGSQVTRLLSQFNIRSRLSQVAPQERWSTGFGNNFWGGGSSPPGKWFEGNSPGQYTEGADTKEAAVLFNSTGTGANPTKTAVLFHLPTQQLSNIGQLSHANFIDGATANDSRRPSDTVNDRAWNSNIPVELLSSTFKIGNSTAPMWLNLDKTRVDLTEWDKGEAYNQSLSFKPWDGSRNNAEGVLYDQAYLMNDALWDSYFFSTVPLINPSTSKLDNSRLEIFRGKSATAKSDGLNGALTDHERSSSALMLKGGFNVNSTSVNAWASILSAFRNIPEPSNANSSNPTSNDLVHSYSRLAEPLGNLIEQNELDPTAANNSDIYTGYRRLSDEEILLLASEIVKEIKNRRSKRKYPFISLSEFINRSIVSSDLTDNEEFMTEGVLQKALKEANINGNPSSGFYTSAARTNVPSSNGAYFNDSLEAEDDEARLEGAVGFLSQVDLLNKIGGVLTARSDTFKIRAYGSSFDNTTNTVQASAYCEAIVQRSPEYVDNSELAYEDPVFNINKTLGRKFRIISFKWLNNNEI